MESLKIFILSLNETLSCLFGLFLVIIVWTFFALLIYQKLKTAIERVVGTTRARQGVIVIVICQTGRPDVSRRRLQYYPLMAPESNHAKSCTCTRSHAYSTYFLPATAAKMAASASRQGIDYRKKMYAY